MLHFLFLQSLFFVKRVVFFWLKQDLSFSMPTEFTSVGIYCNYALLFQWLLQFLLMEPL